MHTNTSSPIQAGLRPGQLSNSTYYLLSLDADLDRIAGIKGGWFHYTQTFFGLRWNNRNMGGDIGDTTIGYQPTFNRDFARLSVLTYEQRLFDDQLAIEVGRTHPNRYYALPPCQSSVSCFQDILQINAGLSSPLYGVWGGNVAYKLSAQDYVQAGAFAVTSGANFPVGLRLELRAAQWRIGPRGGRARHDLRDGSLSEPGGADRFLQHGGPRR